ncbi:MAG: hypothetical protein ACYC2K_07165 [Gemmatimonadales bacterium]
MSVLHLLSTVVLVLVGAGLYYRKRPRVHLGLMLAALAVDLGLVLYIEITRSAIETVRTAPLGPVLTFHIVASVLVLVIYLIQLGLGVRKLRHGMSSHLAHRYLGITFVVLRVANYATSYMISAPEPEYAEERAVGTLAVPTRISAAGAVLP